MGRFYPRSFEGEAPPEFGIDANTITVRTIALDSALADKEIEIGGNFIWIVDASDLDANIQFTFTQSGSNLIPAKKGFFLRGVEFSSIFVTAPAQSGKFITLVTGVDETNAVQIENPTADYTSVTLAKSNTLGTVSDVSVGAASQQLIVAADTSRVSAIITNLSGNTATMRVGDSNAGATRGTPLAPGETITLPVTAAIYAYNPGAGAESLAVSLIED